MYNHPILLRFLKEPQQRAPHLLHQRFSKRLCHAHCCESFKSPCYVHGLQIYLYTDIRIVHPILSSTIVICSRVVRGNPTDWFRRVSHAAALRAAQLLVCPVLCVITITILRISNCGNCLIIKIWDRKYNRTSRKCDIHKQRQDVQPWL